MNDHDRTPPQTKSREERIQSWVRTLLPLLTLGLLAYGGVVFLRELRTPASTSALPQTSAVSPSLPASPIVVQFPSEMTVVTHTPIPETPVPVIPEATPVGLDICTKHTPKGTVCKQPKRPPPPPTEVPPCPVEVGKNCVGQGGEVRHLPTPNARRHDAVRRDGMTRRLLLLAAALGLSSVLHRSGDATASGNCPERGSFIEPVPTDVVDLMRKRLLDRLAQYAGPSPAVVRTIPDLMPPGKAMRVGGTVFLFELPSVGDPDFPFLFRVDAYCQKGQL